MMFAFIAFNCLQFLRNKLIYYESRCNTVTAKLTHSVLMQHRRWSLKWMTRTCNSTTLIITEAI